MKHKIMQVGNSLGITIPAQFVKAVGLRPGDTVEVLEKPQRGEVIYKFSGIKQLMITDKFLQKH